MRAAAPLFASDAEEGTLPDSCSRDGLLITDWNKVLPIGQMKFLAWLDDDGVSLRHQEWDALERGRLVGVAHLLARATLSDHCPVTVLDHPLVGDDRLLSRSHLEVGRHDEADHAYLLLGREAESIAVVFTHTPCAFSGLPYVVEPEEERYVSLLNREAHVGVLFFIGGVWQLLPLPWIARGARGHLFNGWALTRVYIRG